MPTFKKIPKKVKEKGCIASGRYCIFTGLMQYGKVNAVLSKAERRGSIPNVGYVVVKGKRYYYCLYGSLANPDIYAK